MIYLLHSTIPLVRSNGQEVAHYLGYVPDAIALHRRLREHRSGHGAKITRAFRRAGGQLLLARTWPEGTHALEAYLKRQGHIQELCPLCGQQFAERRKRRARLRYAALNVQPPLHSDVLAKVTGGDLPASRSIDLPLPGGVSPAELFQDSSTPSGSDEQTQPSGGVDTGATVKRTARASTPSVGTKQRST